MENDSLSEINELLVTYIRSKTHNPAVNLDLNTSILNSGILDSIAVLDLIVFLEEKLGIIITDSDLVPENFETIGSMINMVRSKRAVKQK